MLSGGKRIDLGPPRQRALLAVLLTHVGRVVPLTSIIKAIWGHNPPRQVTGTLQAYVSRLRKVLRHHDRSVQLTHHLHGYLLDADARLVDAVVFEAKVKDCRRLLKAGDLEGASSAAWSALELWKGKPLGELCDYEFAVLEADRLEQVRLRALDVWAQACLRMGAYEEVAVQLGEELRRNPSLERLGGQLMTAQYHSGQPAEALLTYERIRTAVAEELGVDLSRELQDLHGEILRQELTDSAVAGPPSRTVLPPRTAQAPEPTAPRAAVSPPPSGDRLVGRQGEVERLQVLLEGVRRGRGRLLLVLGEQGMGKTRLVHEMAQLAGAGVCVVRSSCSAVPSSPVYWVWEQAVLQLGREDTDRGADQPPLQAQRTPEQHFAYQMQTCQAVLLAAERGPLILLLEDLHFADVRVLELLHLLVRHISHAPVMVLATMRDHELAKDRALRRAVGRILQEGNSGTVRLRGLTEGQSRELIAAVRGTMPPQDEVRRLHRASGGNPFLLHSLLATPTTGEGPEGHPVPFEAREVLYERLSNCSADAFDVLTLCAVIGTRVRRPLLAGVLSLRGLPQNLVDDVLQTGLLRPDPADEGQLTFTHGLVRDLLVQDAQPLIRARWHHDVAAVLAARFQPGNATAEIRHHCLQASRVLGADEGLRPLLNLADQAQQRFFHAESLRYLVDVASVIAALPRDEPTSAVELRLRKQMMWLHALLEGYGSPRVTQAFGQARQLEQTFDITQPTELLHTQAIAAIAEGRYSAAAETAGLLHELAEHGGGEEARSAACYADGVTLHVSGRLDEALAALGQGVDIIDRLLNESGGQVGLSALLNDQRIDYRAYLALTHWLSGDRTRAQHYRSELLQLTQSDRYDRPWDRAFARYVDALLAVAEGDVQGAWRAGRAGVDLTARCQLTYWHRMLAVPLGWAEVYEGRTERGLARIRSAVRDAAGHRTLLRRTLHLGLLADALRHTGADDAARQVIARAAREIEERGEHVYLRPQWPFASLLRENPAGVPSAHATLTLR
ncbi:BTAD domain-containing putative transcriptional regulator [Streptomyces sp. MMS24-I31]